MVGKEITLELKNPELYILVGILAFILIMELQVTFSTPISFGDEGFHVAMGRWIAQNVEYPKWQPLTVTKTSTTSFNRPPFWNILEAGFFYILGFSEAVVKFLVPFTSILTGLTVYTFTKKFYNKEMGFIASIITVTVPSFVTYSVLFYTDIMITFLMTMFFFILMMGVKSGRKLHMLTAGAFGSLVFMTKLTGYVAHILAGIVFVYLLVKERKKVTMIKDFYPLILMMAIVPSFFFIRNLAIFGTPVCYRLPLIGNFYDNIFDLGNCRVSSFQPEYEYEGRTNQVGTESGVFQMGIANYLNFAYGSVWFVVFAFVCGTYIMANRLKMVDEIILIFTALSIFVFLISTQRAEDTARYMLIWVPMISIISAKYMDTAYKFIKQYQKYIALVVFIIVIYFSYQNAASKLLSMKQVKGFSPLFFDACEWGRENLPEDSLISTVWTHRTSYSCERRVTASLPDMALSQNVTHIVSTAEKVGITHIFIQKFSLSDKSLSEKYPISYVRLLEDNPDSFKKVFENGPGIDQCLQQGGCDGNIIYEVVY